MACLSEFEKHVKALSLISLQSYYHALVTATRITLVLCSGKEPSLDHLCVTCRDGAVVAPRTTQAKLSLASRKVFRESLARQHVRVPIRAGMVAFERTHYATVGITYQTQNWCSSGVVRPTNGQYVAKFSHLLGHMPPLACSLVP